MRISFAYAKEKLAKHALSVDLDDRINRACERLILHGKFVGSVVRLALAAQYGNLVLPRRCQTLLGVKVEGRPFSIANQWYEFLESRNDAKGYSLNAVRDLGDGFATLTDLPSGGSIKVEVVSGTPGEDFSVRIFGEGDSSVVETTPTDETPSSDANPFTTITRISKPSGVSIRVTHLADEGTSTLLALMEPGETETFYRRYMLDTLADQASASVTARCKLRHVEMVADDDILPFGNLSAVGLAMDALQYESENDLERATVYFANAVNLLNKELGSSQAPGTFPAIRFLYPGGTEPRFRSHL